MKFCCVVFAGLVLPAVLVADDWPQFLGKHRTGLSAETGLIQSFPDDGPHVLWRTALGPGMSGVAVQEDSVYTLYQDTDHQYATALDAATGKQKWVSPVAPFYRNAMGNGPRATPTVTEKTVFVFSGEGILAALDAATGQVNWKVDTPADLNSRPAEYGMASSPLVIGDVVVVQVGSEKGTVAGYDLSSGQRRWAAGHGPGGYSSPVVMTLAGTKQIVAFAGDCVIGIAADTGQQLWQYPYVTDYQCNTATPVQLDHSRLLISSGENHGAAILKVAPDNGTWSVSTSWNSFGRDSVLRAEWQTPVLQDGYLFGLDNVGSAGPITNLVCIRADDGKQVWSRPRFGKSNLTLADGKLFLSTMKGELVIVTADPTKFSETGRAQVLGMTRQAPVIADGRLYLRDDREIVAIDISQPR